MAPLLLGSIFEFGGKLIDRLIPDPAQKLAAQQELMKMAIDKELAVMANDTALVKMQTDINLEEAKSDSLFKSGWRPGAGWVFVAALAWQFILRPIIETGFIFYTGHAVPVPLPTLDGMLWELGFGMLGLGSLRKFVKVKG
jgi:hypothetical protein